MTARQLIITVDTELSNFPDGQGLWGRTGNGEWGLPRLLDGLAEMDAPATFFLDVYGREPGDVAHQRRAAELIVARRQDLQLHTHPGPAFDPSRPRLRDYALGEQQEILEFGRDRIEAWTGTRPTLHRAGDWGADGDSLTALSRSGFEADFSASPWSSNCAIDDAVRSRNGWARVGPLLCGIGTCFHDRITGRIRRVDVGGVSRAELLEVLGLGVDPFILTLHSFSLMNYDRSRTRFEAHPTYMDDLAYLCRVARDVHGYRVVSALEAVRSVTGGARLATHALPSTSLAASAMGLAKSIRARFSWSAA